ncbi:MAG TPA: hypothetical protein H9796_10915 [Candidatus Butyricimonas faecavium]|nr:hypothetical protein [Candidatus Butyricimonas faecavium]
MQRLVFLFILAVMSSCTDDKVDIRTVSFMRPYYILPQSQSLEVEIRLSEPVDQELVIPFSVGGSAVENDEYVLSAHEFIVSAGQDSAVISITPQNNFSSERQISLTLDIPEGYGAGIYKQTIIPMERRTALTVEFVATEYDLYEEGVVGVKLKSGSSEYRPSYDAYIPFEIDPSSTAELGVHYEFVGENEEFFYGRNEYIGTVRLKCLKKEVGKDRIVLRLVENERFLASLDNDRACIMIAGPITFENLKGSWKFKTFLSDNAKYYGGLVNEDPEKLPKCDVSDVLVFEERDGKNVVNTRGLIGDLKNYFIDGATVSVDNTGEDHMYYHSGSIDMEEHLDREVIRTTFSEVNLAFSATVQHVDKANVDIRLIGENELEVRIVQYEPVDFLVDPYNSRKNDSTWNRDGLPMKGQYTLIFRFTRQL